MLTTDFDATLYKIGDRIDILSFEISQVINLQCNLIEHHESVHTDAPDNLESCCNDLRLSITLMRMKHEELRELVNSIGEERKQLESNG